MIVPIAMILSYVAAYGAHWTYDDQNSWPGMCTIGESQSPISIETGAIDQSVRMDDLQIIYDIVDNAPLSISDHGIDVVVNDDEIRYTIGNVRDYDSDIFILSQFHAHWGLTDEFGSEHLFEGVSYSMEVHFVHYNLKYGSVGDAKGKTGGLAVIGVLFEIGKANKEIEKILDAINSGNDNVPSINLNALIPEDARTKLFSYDGSLTTPTCDENLLWYVAKTTMTVSKNQMEALRSIVGPNGDIIAPNYRDVQPLNGRSIYVTDALKHDVAAYCQRICDNLMSCAHSKHGSYCKSNGVCFGLYHKDDSYCFQPTDLTDCNDSVLEPVMCSSMDAFIMV
ncbi:Carbonic anhydrase, putative [Perkinsus marinus ATCC 50983]|uniref:carbonic anhydrase n=1 Tax=Perkinsus marinus (strain ATCC 50983 / TXsc) TaxID=423536 RepID=C5LW05_PERM5|nr:Carbonic anhydrase, putative [Perkinsus marinus ATCC 50983]EEQ99075.1 Carbonic anhydrase, putative [Perkinsus marinus ATCC 50983]|eukprot:XP_002766358.1 Carbonic anhydrase, putative [Perkinsus marinus ATCC 50983]